MKRDELIQTIAETSGIAKRLTHSHFQHAFRQLGLSASQVHLLFTIEHQQPVNASQLAEQLQMTRGAVSQTVDALLKADLLVRSADTSDRRLSNLYVSPAGKQKVAQFNAMRTEILTQALTGLDTSELTTYLSIQRKMIDYFRTHDAPHPTATTTSKTPKGNAR